MTSSKSVQRATPAQDTVEITRSKVEHHMLPEAVDTIYEMMSDPEAPRELRFKCATWLADKFLANANKIVDPTQAGRAAVVLAETLREILTKDGGQITPETVEGKFREITEREVGSPIVLSN